MEPTIVGMCVALLAFVLGIEAFSLKWVLFISLMIVFI